MATEQDLEELTIRDFGEQWQRYQIDDGYYASKNLLADIVGPLFDLADLEGKTVCDIGSGTGRIVNMLLDWGAHQVTAVEPSKAAEVLARNTQGKNVRIINAPGDRVPADVNADYVFSIGVLHHIADPAPVVQAAHTALVPGGKMLVWLYGFEGNEGYLRVIEPIRKFTPKLPDTALIGICHLLNLVLDVYIFFTRFIRLPLADYMQRVIGKFSRQKRFLVIFDQLNPTYAKYYRREEAIELLEKAGFVDVQVFHRHGYSWTVFGQKRTPEIEEV